MSMIYCFVIINSKLALEDNLNDEKDTFLQVRFYWTVVFARYGVLILTLWKSARVLVRFRFATSKAVLDIYCKNQCIRVALWEAIVHLENLKIGWRKSVVPNISPRNKTLVIVVKSNSQADIKALSDLHQSLSATCCLHVTLLETF